MEISSDDKLWGLLMYLFTPLTPVIMLFLNDKKDRPFIKAHKAQALAFGVIALVINLVCNFLPPLGCITGLATLVINIYLAIKAYNGGVFDIPLITNFVKGQGWA